jgi:hypothetical protein
MSAYRDLMWSHLSKYRMDRLGISDCGTWNGRPYSHILPPELRCLNFLEAFQAEIQEHLRENPQVHLHRNFHHLNSSQAFALNLFFPFLHSGATSARALSAAVGIDADVTDWHFERVHDEAEGTNVDVTWRTSSKDGWVFCEVKLTETDFGSGANDVRHRLKLERTYIPRLKRHVDPDLLRTESFLENYQLLRNIHLVAEDPRHRLAIVLPRGNEKLTSPLNRVLNAINQPVRAQIVTAYVEDCIDRLRAEPSLSEKLRVYATMLAEKYDLSS